MLETVKLSRNIYIGPCFRHPVKQSYRIILITDRITILGTIMLKAYVKSTNKTQHMYPEYNMYMDLLSVTSKDSLVRYSDTSICCTARPLVSKLIVIQVKHCNCNSLSKRSTEVGGQSSRPIIIIELLRQWFDSSHIIGDFSLHKHWLEISKSGDISK